MIVSICVASAVVAAGAFGFLLTRSNPPFPSSIAKQVSFVTYVPAHDWSADTAHATYNAGVLLFTAQRTNVTLSLSEQATPSVFGDVPQYYSALLGKMNQYDSFGTANGTVYLTKPTELNGLQTAVLNNDGTLVFVRPNHAMSADQWRQFFNTLRLIK